MAKRQTAELLITELIVLNFQDLSQGVLGRHLTHIENHQGKYMYEGMYREKEEESKQKVDVFGIEI